MKKNTACYMALLILVPAIFFISCTRENKKTPEKDKSETFYHLPTISFSTADSPKKFGHITASLCCTKRTIKKIKLKIDLISSSISDIVKKKKSSDMDSIEDLNNLKKEIRLKVSSILDEKIKRIIINEIIIR